MVEDFTLAPKWNVKINGNPINDDVKNLIYHLEYESADGLADVARIRVKNPDSMVSNLKEFQPGNEMSIYMGYGSLNLIHIGRVKIIRVALSYPQEDEPTMVVVGYTKDVEMMDNEPKKSKVKKKTKGKKKKGREGRTWAGSNWKEIIESVAKYYHFKTDVDNVPGYTDLYGFQKVGMSDYDFINGIANNTNHVFWVDGEEGTNNKTAWTLHFKSPQNLDGYIQYNFDYDNGDYSSLLSFNPELLVKNARTKIGISMRDRVTGKIINSEVEVLDTNTPDLDASTGASETIDEEFVSGASNVKLYFEDYSFEMMVSKRFKTEAQITDWVQQWFKRVNDDFILSRGISVGNENVRARQRHIVAGISPPLNGEYYFSKVKHVMSPTDGYKMEFGARKVLI